MLRKNEFSFFRASRQFLKKYTRAPVLLTAVNQQKLGYERN